MHPSLAGAARVFVRCPNPVGDLVMATPALEALRRAMPEARIALGVRPYSRGVVAGAPWYDELVPCGTGLRDAARAIRVFGPDAAIVLPGSMRTALEARLGGARWVFGYRRGGRGPLLTDGPRPLRDGGRYRPGPMIDYYLELARWLGARVPDEPRPRLYVTDEEERFAAELFERHGIGPGETVVGLNPGAKFGSSKCWPAERFARLAERLERDLGARLLLLVGPGEEPIAEAIVRDTAARVIDTRPDRVDLARLKAVVRRLDLLVTNDTGPRHYAVAFDLPVVVVMGPTDPRWTAANLERTVVIRRELDCSPCHEKACPTDHRCMTGVNADEVYEAAAGLLATERKKGEEAAGG